MKLDDLIDTLRKALVEEREAILSLDSAALARANEIKEEVLRRLREMTPAERISLATVLDPLQSDLRTNLRLLTHARWLIDDAKQTRSEVRSKETGEAVDDKTGKDPNEKAG